MKTNLRTQGFENLVEKGSENMRCIDYRGIDRYYGDIIAAPMRPCPRY